MAKRNEAVREQKHGSLDADAAARLDALLDVAKRGGLDVTLSEMMSRAIRFYHAALSESVTVAGRDDPGDPPTIQ